MAEPENITPEPAPAEKTFTQTEVDNLIGKRLAKAMKGMPDEAELTAFRAWKDSQQTEKEKWDTLTQERDTAKTELETAKAELEQYKREKLLLDKGVPAADVDYYAFKIGKLVTDKKTFEEAAEEYLKDAPAEKRVRVDMTGALGKGGAPEEPKSLREALSAKYERK